MKQRKVYIRFEPLRKCVFVMNFERTKGQRYWSAAFTSDDHSQEWVMNWVRNNPKLQLVCAISGKPL